MINLLLFVFLGTVLIVGMGNYLARLINYETMIGDRFYKPFERSVLRFFKSEEQSMGWKQYTLVILLFNAAVALVSMLILMTQGFYTNVPNMPFALAFNTIASFMTNTNLQHYTPELHMSQFGQMFAIMTQMFSSAATGIAVGMAFIRGLTQSPHRLGNALRDLVSVITRLLIPFSMIVALLLVWQGVPQTMHESVEIMTLDGVKQSLQVGPIAAFEAIKHIGTNGGGFFAANSSMPFENPTALSNLIQMLSMMMIPGGFIVAFGICAKKCNKKWIRYGSESTPLIIISLLLFITGVFFMYQAELQGNPALLDLGLSNSMNLEGKELRFGILDSVLFTGVSTSFTTGSVNSMLDSYTPMGGLVPLVFMMLNIVFGGDGVGIMNLMMYVLLTVFICGLMIGRTPEYLGKKIESYEMKRIAFVILIHPILILCFSALAVVLDGDLGTRDFSRILYEFTSAAANNGSGFEGLADNTVFWNISSGIVMIVGRFIPMILQLQIVASLHRKQMLAPSIGTLKTNTFIFTVSLGVVIVIMSALTFFPVIMLGPIAEMLGYRIGV